MSNTIKQIHDLSREKILRPTYGQTSLSNWEVDFDLMLKKFEFMLKYWSQVDSRTNGQVQNLLNSILQTLERLSTLDESQYVSNRQNLSGQVNQAFNDIKQYWPQYAIAAIEESGLLDNIDVKKEFEALTENLKTSTDTALKKIESESQAIIEQAKKKADDIELSIRKTAQKISVQEAQEQFQNAILSNNKNIIIWGSITTLLIIAFVIYFISMLHVNLSDTWTWKVVYFSGLRVGFIGFIGSLLAFSLKILKSYLHIKEHNQHRQRIANSMASFAESATNRDQRDLILSRLIDSVSNFGNSGMVGNDDDSNPKITIDNITRTLSALKTGSN
jgi:hypothetical protein